MAALMEECPVDKPEVVLNPRVWDLLPWTKSSEGIRTDCHDTVQYICTDHVASSRLKVPAGPPRGDHRPTSRYVSFASPVTASRTLYRLYRQKAYTDAAGKTLTQRVWMTLLRVFAWSPYP